MFRQSWKCGLVGLVVAIALLASAVPVSAGWGHHCCGYGGYWGYYSPWYYSGWYSSCGWGGCGGCYSGCYGSYSSCYSGWGCGSYCSTCSAVSSCCGDSAVAAPAAQPTLAPAAPAPTPARKPIIEPLTPEPAAPAPGLPGPAPSTTMPKTSGPTSADSGVLTIWVPYDAKVTVNGLETHSTGSRRQFISYGLKPGFNYKYVIRATVVRDGQVQEEVPQTVMLTAGKVASVAFGFNTTSPLVAAR